MPDHTFHCYPALGCATFWRHFTAPFLTRDAKSPKFHLKMAFPATAFGRLRSLQYLLFLLYFALVFKSFFRLVSFLPADFLTTLDQTKYYLLRYLRIFLVTGALLVTNSEVADAFIALAVMLAAYGIGRKCLRLSHCGFDSSGRRAGIRRRDSASFCWPP